jgi:hypothetical protein
MPILANLTETALHRAVGPWNRAGSRMDMARFHMRQARLCERIIAGLAEREATRLDPADARRAEAYAADVLGWRGYAPWLKVYTLRAGRFREGWIPDDYYSQVVVPRINGAYRHMAQMRQVGIRLFGADVVPDSLHVVRGRFLLPDGTPVTAGDAASLLFARGDRAVFKANWSGSGASIRILRRGDFPGGAPWPDGVFQHFVRAHPDLGVFPDDATATLRVTTALDPEGRPRLRTAYIRLPRATDGYVHVATLIRVMLDLDTGAFDARGMLSDWTVSGTHPDTGVPYAGQQMPGFAAARDLALAMHRGMPLVGCIGWDFAVDAAARPWLLEWNAVHNDIKVSEAMQGPCFAGLGWDRLWRDSAAGTA